MSNGKVIFGFDLDKDVRSVEAMATRLKPYIYEDELYGMMNNGLPQLTVGGLLMRLHRLPAILALLTPAQQQTLATATEQWQKIRDEWRVAYEGKIIRELPARFLSITQFLEDCTDSRRCAENFPSTMEKRVIAEVLKDEAEALGVMTEELTTRLRGIDNGIHRFTQRGSFCWDARLLPAYPEEKFWFLYTDVVHNGT